MFTEKELTKLIDYLYTQNFTMQKDIDKSGHKMPTLKALFKIEIAENKAIIQKLETLRLQQ